MKLLSVFAVVATVLAAGNASAAVYSGTEVHNAIYGSGEVVNESTRTEQVTNGESHVSITDDSHVVGLSGVFFPDVLYLFSQSLGSWFSIVNP